MTTLDDLNTRLQRSREAVGRNLPVRLKIVVGAAGADQASAQIFVSERIGSTDLRILLSRRAVEDLNAQAREDSADN
jgi:hypothetical protein